MHRDYSPVSFQICYGLDPTIEVAVSFVLCLSRCGLISLLAALNFSMIPLANTPSTSIMALCEGSLAPEGPHS